MNRFEITLRTMLPIIVIVTLGLTAIALPAQRQRRIAIMSFDVGTDARQQAATQFNMHGDLGRELSDLLMQKLVTDGKFIIVERTKLDQIIHEQNLSNSDRNDTTTAAKIGKILGVDAIVIGSVTQFGGEQKTTNVGGLGRFGSLGAGVLSRKTSTVNVTTTARLVDTNDGQVLAMATGAGSSNKTQTSVRTQTSSSASGLDMKSADFASSLIGQATLQAIDMMAVQLEAAPAAAPIAAPPRVAYSGVVADVSGSTLILTVGTTAGVRVGDEVQISRPVRTVKNPSTGAVLKVITKPLGNAKITEADANSATATFEGTGPVKVDDNVSGGPATQ